MPLFNSPDFILDACDSLDQGKFPYLLIVGVSDDHTRLESNLTQEERQMLLDWIRNGHLETIFLNHINQ